MKTLEDIYAESENDPLAVLLSTGDSKGNCDAAAVDQAFGNRAKIDHALNEELGEVLAGGVVGEQDDNAADCFGAEPLGVVHRRDYFPPFRFMRATPETPVSEAGPREGTLRSYAAASADTGRIELARGNGTNGLASYGDLAWTTQEASLMGLLPFDSPTLPVGGLSDTRTRVTVRFHAPAGLGTPWTLGLFGHQLSYSLLGGSQVNHVVGEITLRLRSSVDIGFGRTRFLQASTSSLGRDLGSGQVRAAVRSTGELIAFEIRVAMHTSVGSGGFAGFDLREPANPGPGPTTARPPSPLATPIRFQPQVGEEIDVVIPNTARGGLTIKEFSVFSFSQPAPGPEVDAG